MDMDIQVSSPSDGGFCLSAYISRYEGITKALRLLFIASSQPSLFTEACHLLNDFLLNSSNTTLYTDFFRAFQDHSQFTIVPNTSWIDATNARNAAMLSKLEQELTAAETGLAKEPIRSSFTALAHHHLETGNLQAAMRYFHESKLYNTTQKHALDMTINILTVLIHMGRGAYLSNFLMRSTGDLEGPVRDKMHFCLGLHSLYCADYTTAAKYFTDISPTIGEAFSSVTCLEDVVQYGVLCSLAALPRQQLQHLVSFPPSLALLETQPDMLQLIKQYLSGNYAAFRRQLLRMERVLCLDLHLSSHVSELFTRIRSKCLQQYLAPYSTVSMASMASAFEYSMSELEQHIVALICDGSLFWKIDAEAQLLYKQHANSEIIALNKVNHLADSYLAKMRAAMMHISLIKHNFCVGVGAGGEGAMTPISAGRSRQETNCQDDFDMEDVMDVEEEK